MSTLTKVLRTVVLVLAVVVCLSVASDVNAGTVYESSDTGALYDVTQSLPSESPYIWAKQSPTLVEGFPDVSFPTTKYFVLPRASKYFQIQLDSGSCSGWDNLTIGNVLGQQITQAIGGVDVGNGICQFSFDTNYPGMSSGLIATSTKIAWFAFCKASGCDDSNGSVVLRGSVTNEGYTYNGNNNYHSKGGVAFKFCDSDGCDLGGFNSKEQIAPNVDSATSYETRIENVEVITTQNGSGEIDLSCEAGEDRLYVYWVENNSYIGINGELLGSLNNGADEYPDGQFPCGTNFGIVNEGNYAFQFCNIGDTFCNGRSDSFEYVKTDVEISAEYFLNLEEFNTSVSEKNPTLIFFSVAKRPSTNFTGVSEAITQVSGTGTAQTTFESLADGVYDLLVKFSNVGCSTGLSSCPFPLSYVYTTFTVSAGVLTSVSPLEVYTNVFPPVLENEYESCDLSNFSGCLNNSLRFLFLPSQDSITNLVETKDLLDTKIPFVYVSDIQLVADEIFNTEQAQSLDVSLDLGFGVVPLINEAMIENAPQAGLIRQLLSYMLWITFALGAYRMALNVHNKEST